MFIISGICSSAPKKHCGRQRNTVFTMKLVWHTKHLNEFQIVRLNAIFPPNVSVYLCDWKLKCSGFAFLCFSSPFWSFMLIKDRNSAEIEKKKFNFIFHNILNISFCTVQSTSWFSIACRLSCSYLDLDSVCCNTIFFLLSSVFRLTLEMY